LNPTIELQFANVDSVKFASAADYYDNRQGAHTLSSYRYVADRARVAVRK
jgi:hypothetical protein